MTEKQIENHLKYLDILEKVALSNEPVARMRVAAALVYRNRIIAIGRNQWKTSPFQKRFGKNPDSIHLHAEVDCIYRASRVLTEKEFRKSTLYVLRVKKSRREKIGIAMPCPGCTAAIEHYEIGQVVFSKNAPGLDRDAFEYVNMIEDRNVLPDAA